MLTRRAAFLAAGGLAAGLVGCRRPGEAAVVFRGWPYEPDLVRANLRRFQQEQPGLPVDYAPISGNYHDKMVAQFVAATHLDVAYARDDHFAEWIDAGWLQPLDGLPGLRELLPRMFPFNREAVTYGSRVYGLPYYSDFNVWAWNSRMLEAAGLAAPGRTLEEITEQCLRIKERRVTGPRGSVTHPISLQLRQAPLGFGDFWNLMFGSEAQLFDEQLQPLFPDDPGRRCERVLQWIVDAVHRHRILDLNTAFTQVTTRDLLSSGRVSMLPVAKYDLQRLNDPARSEVAPHVRMAPIPSLEPGQRGTMGVTRLYVLPRACRHPERAWQLLRFLGGDDGQGRISTQRFWFLQRGLGFTYPELFADEDVVRSIARWGNLEEVREASRYVRARAVIQAPWFAQFDSYYQAELQEVLQRRRSPRDGLARIAAHTRRLAAAWNGAAGDGHAARA